MNMTSATGRRPVSAAPLAAPTIADSVIGVSITRARPNSAASPAVTPNVPPAASTSPAVPPMPADDVLTENDDAGITTHLGLQHFGDRFTKGFLRPSQ